LTLVGWSRTEKKKESEEILSMQLVEEKKNNEEHKFLASRGELNISLNLPWYVSGKICFFWVFDQRG